MYVTDTHPVVHHLNEKPSRLGGTARRIFNDAEEGRVLIYIPAVVLWELTRRLMEGAFVLSIPFEHWCRSIEHSKGFAIAPLEWTDVDQARKFPFKDPFDCLIAGTAAHLGMPLITKDAEIRESRLVETVW